jgi:hypothetical protein
MESDYCIDNTDKTAEYKDKLKKYLEQNITDRTVSQEDLDNIFQIVRNEPECEDGFYEKQDLKVIF